ncbi:MAG: ribbon-helix-helix domain-containing protein [Nitrososphaeraceae archaeon]
MVTSDIHIRIPRKLYEMINDLVVKEGHYRSAPEFILECARQKIDEIKNNRIEQRKINVYWHRLRTEKEKENECNPQY